jgi:hypothetical protein
MRVHMHEETVKPLAKGFITAEMPGTASTGTEFLDGSGYLL